MSAPSTPTTINFVQAQPFVLAGSGASIGDTTLVLQSMVGIDGQNIVTADLGSFAYGTLEPGNGAQEEAILFTGVTQNANGTATLTGVQSLGFKTPYTLTSGVQKTHAGASKFILSNDAAFYNNLVLYMNSIAGAGAANASTTVKGLVQAATSAQINSGTATGSTGAVLAVTPDALLASNYALSSGVSAALAGSSGTPSATNKFVTQASLKFGGTGSDGALSVTSGTTTIDLGNAALVVKNYTSISVTGTGKVAFSNPNSNGTMIILKSQGNVTLTTSGSPAIDASGMGSAAGAAGSGSTAATTATIARTSSMFNTIPGNVSNSGGIAPLSIITNVKGILMAPGVGGGGGGQYTAATDGAGGGGGASIINSGSAGGAAGGNTAGTASAAGGRGGAALYIECAGTYTNTLATVSVAGLAGSNSASNGSGAGGGGAGGTLYIYYNVLGSDTGTYTITGGAGGTNANGNHNGGAGATGYSSVGLNTDFT